MTRSTINDAVTMQGGATGTLLAGRYRVVRQLGQGGMGSVWLAEDTQLDNKRFAIKMLPSILVSNKRAYRQLKDEALVAMQLVHPNIVQIRAFEENNGNPFLVMDYIEGKTLDDCLADWGTLNFGETVALLKPIAAALDYAHGRGVVHRDVKPGNVMIARNGTPYILDFGIAREIQETMTRVTGKLSSGTLLYMSPEQLGGDMPTPAQDVYSFAAMAYECMKGEPPFVRGAIEDQIRNKTPEPLISSGQVMAGLAKKPVDRPKTCAAVLERDGLAQRRRVAEPASRPSRPTIPSRQSQGLGALVAIIVLLAALAGGGYFAWAKHDAMVKARKAEAARIAAEQRAKEEAAWSAMDNAGAAKRRAEEASSSKYATKSFGDAVKLFESANEKFARRQFDEARTTFAVAAERFENCIVEAKAERKRQEAAARKAAEEARMEAERKVATEIRIEAKIQQGRVARISDGDGFKERKDSLTDTFNRAEVFYDEKEKRWADAAALYTNYVERSKTLISLDGERQRAAAKKGEVQVSFKKAEEAGAKMHARDSWNAAVKTWEAAAVEFGRREFAAAAETFAKALREFDECLDEARNNKRIAEEKREKELLTKQFLDACNAKGYDAAARLMVYADVDNADVQYNLGNMYYKGNGVLQNYAEAIKWYDKSAKQGNSAAQLALAHMYASGHGVMKNVNLAVHWYAESAKRGNAEAQNEMGACYSTGWGGTEKNYAKANMWFRRSAEQGFAIAQHNLGFAYEYGHGVAVDYAEAARWYYKAACQGHDMAQFFLGYLYNEGLGVKQDYAEAFRWYKASAEQGYYVAQNNLAVLYEDGKGVARNMQEAVRWYRKSAAQGYEKAQTALRRLGER